MKLTREDYLSRLSALGENLSTEDLEDFTDTFDALVNEQGASVVETDENGNKYSDLYREQLERANNLETKYRERFFAPNNDASVTVTEEKTTIIEGENPPDVSETQFEDLFEDAK